MAMKAVKDAWEEQEAKDARRHDVVQKVVNEVHQRVLEAYTTWEERDYLYSQIVLELAKSIFSRFTAGLIKRDIEERNERKTLDRKTG